MAAREVELSAEITQWGILAPIILAAIAAAVAIAKIFRPRQNGNGREKAAVPSAAQIIADIDPRASDATTIKKLEAQLLLIRDDEALRFKEKVEELAKSMVKLQALTDDITKELSEAIIQAGLDRGKVLDLDRRLEIMKAIDDYDSARKNKNQKNGPI